MTKTGASRANRPDKELDAATRRRAMYKNILIPTDGSELA